LIEIIGADHMDEETANAVIMAARAHWFDDEASDAGEEPVGHEVPVGHEAGVAPAEETGHD
jgi:hypothetical protein